MTSTDPGPPNLFYAKLQDVLGHGLDLDETALP